MNKNYKALTLASLGLSLLGACGVKNIPTEHGTLKPVKDSSLHPIAVTEDSSVDPSIANLPTPCAYWKDVPTAGADRSLGQALQLFDQLAIEGTGNKQILKGRHNLSLMPQVLFALSAEANGGTTRVNPPTVDEFMVLARKKLSAGSLVEKASLKALEAAYAAFKFGKMDGEVPTGFSFRRWTHEAAAGFLISQRNSAVQEQLEGSLPGVLSGKAGNLAADQLNADLKNQVGVPVTLEQMKVLERVVALFPSKRWNDRAADLSLAMKILAKTAADKSLKIEEKICRFAISHRVTAQVLALKGIGGAPQLTENGVLLPLPTGETQAYPVVEVPGTFGVVANEAWIKAQIENPSKRPALTESSEDFLQSFNTMLAITRHRDANLWAVPEIKDKDGKVLRPADVVAPGTLRLPVALLKLGMGFFAIEAKIMARDELVLTNPDRITLRVDSSDAIAVLAHTAMNISESFSSLSKPNALESLVLSADQISAFTASYDNGGVVAKMDRLTLGLAFEGLGRIKAGQSSESLKAVIRRIGRKTGNAAWINLE